MPHHTKGSPARATADCQHRGNSIAERGDKWKKGAEMREGISTPGLQESWSKYRTWGRVSAQLRPKGSALFTGMWVQVQTLQGDAWPCNTSKTVFKRIGYLVPLDLDWQVTHQHIPDGSDRDAPCATVTCCTYRASLSSSMKVMVMKTTTFHAAFDWEIGKPWKSYKNGQGRSGAPAHWTFTHIIKMHNTVKYKSV